MKTFVEQNPVSQVPGLWVLLGSGLVELGWEVVVGEVDGGGFGLGERDGGIGMKLP